MIRRVPVALIAALIIGLAAGAGIRQLRAEPVRDAPPPEAPVVTDDLTDLRDALAAAERETERLATELEARRAQLAAQPEPVAPEPAVEDEGPRFRSEELDEALSSVDWPSVAEALGGMHAVVTQLIADPDRLKRDDMPAELRGKLTAHNGKLVTAAVAAAQSGVPGPGPNGAYTHPYMMANAAAARLAAAGLPLTDEQARGIETLLAAATKDLARIDEAEHELRLERWTQESAARRTFLDGLHTLLDDAQRAALCPPAARHRVGLDLFSEGLMGIGHVHPVAFTDRAGLASSCAALVVSRLGMPESQETAARRIVTEWVEALPADSLSGPRRDFDEVGRLHADRIVTAGRDQLPLLRRLLAELELDEDARQRIRRLSVPLLPLARE